jgi:hypothetical protein
MGRFCILPRKHQAERGLWGQRRACPYLPQVSQDAAREAGRLEARARNPWLCGAISHLPEEYCAPANACAFQQHSNRESRGPRVGSGHAHTMSASTYQHAGAATSRHADANGGGGTDSSTTGGRKQIHTISIRQPPGTSGWR